MIVFRRSTTTVATLVLLVVSSPALSDMWKYGKTESQARQNAVSAATRICKSNGKLIRTDDVSCQGPTTFNEYKCYIRYNCYKPSEGYEVR